MQTKYFDKYCACYMTIFSGSKKLRTKFFSKTKAIVPKKKDFGPFFSYSYCPVRQTTSIFPLGWTRFFAESGASYKIISLTPKRLWKTQFFEKKRLFLWWKTIQAKFFSYYRVWQSSRNNLWKFTRCFDNDCVSYKIFSLGPMKLLKTQTFEKITQIFQSK